MRLRSASLLLAVVSGTLAVVPVATAQAVQRFLGPEEMRGQPYTLSMTITGVKTLADGTHITSTRTETHSRDSEGRTRIEVWREVEGKQTMELVALSDPMTNLAVSLAVPTKVAYVTHLPEGVPPTAEQQAHMAEAQANAENSRLFHEEALAARTIAGVRAEGRRTILTIPAGKQGNDRDLHTTSEVWNSPELGIDLDRSYDDPWNGKVSIVVTSLERTEPDPVLFKIPAEYQIAEQPMVAPR